MSTRSLLILASLIANLTLVLSFHYSSKRMQNARNLVMQQNSDISRLREVSSRVKPGVVGISTRAMGQDLVILQKVKMAVASQVARNRSKELRCKQGATSQLGLLINSMADYKKKLDILMAKGNRGMSEREALMMKIEEEARKLKGDLLRLCAR